MKNDLKPCPFCGGEAAFHEHERVGVECIECGAGFACVYRDRDEAAEEWNRRAERTCHPVLEDETLVCSECGEDIDGYGWNYCPNCGARVVDDGA